MRPSPSRAVSRLLFTVTAFAAALPAFAEWPQWRGPNRDDRSTETGLMKDWPVAGPPRVWLYDNTGLGYSGPAVVNNRLYTMGAREDKEYLIALDISKPQPTQVWAVPIGEVLENNWGNGPRGTPTVDGENIYALGAQGVLVCVGASGKTLWSKKMQDLGGKTPNWGYSESPLIYENLVLCTPGGEKGAIAALDKKSGDVVWQTKELTPEAHYSSMVKADRPQGPEVVQLLQDQVVGVNPKDGKVLWTHPWPGKVAVIPTPIVEGPYVYVTTSYGVGCMGLEIGDGYEVKKLYENKNMKNKHGGVVLVGDKLYGYADDIGWTCQDLKTGERVWREREKLESGALTYAENRLYCIGENEGQVVLIEASPEGWKEHGRFTLDPQTKLRKPQGKIWTHPVVADGKLYLRDQELLFCFDIRDGAKQTAAVNR